MARGFFKGLDIEMLKTYASEWVKGHSYVRIEQVELRRYTPIKEVVNVDTDAPKVQYAIVFKTLEPAEAPFFALSVEARELVEKAARSLAASGDEDPKLLKTKKKRRDLVDSIVGVLDEDHIRRVTGEVPTSPLEKLIARTGYRETLWPRKYRRLVGHDFKSVYRNEPPPGKNFLNEWIFIALARDESLPSGVVNSTPPVLLYEAPAHKRRARTPEKAACQKIASDVWAKYPILKIKHMLRHPDIVGVVGRYFHEKTLRAWLSEVAPEDAKKPGRLSAKALKGQKAMCDKLGIEWT
jgi:hypothetical protein